MHFITRYNFIFLLLLGMLLPCQAPLAATVVTTLATETGRQEVLALQKYIFWQQINVARRDPRAVLERLDIGLQQAQTALGAEAWILDRGLRPLAWNDRLNQAASKHGRDMIDNLYYSHVSRDGSGPTERIAATGYQAVFEEESLGALAFDNYIAYETAVAALLDNMLRDELTAVSGVRRNIFSTALTEVGASFFGESLPLLAGQPYVYLLVLDFATPLEPSSYLVGTLDPENRLALRSMITGFWEFLPLLPGPSFQVALPQGGAVLVSLNGQNQVVSTVSVFDHGSATNRFVNLSVEGGEQ